MTYNSTVVEPFASLGFEPEMVGGGAFIAARYAESGAYVWISGAQGDGMPAPDDWMICFYPVGYDGDELELQRASYDTDADLKTTLAEAIALLEAEPNGEGESPEAKPAMPLESVPADLREPVIDRASAEAFLTALKREGLDHHFDDGAVECLHGNGLVTLATAVFIDLQVRDCYAAWEASGADLRTDCPIGFMLVLMERAGELPDCALS